MTFDALNVGISFSNVNTKFSFFCPLPPRPPQPAGLAYLVEEPVAGPLEPAVPVCPDRQGQEASGFHCWVWVGDMEFPGAFGFWFWLRPLFDSQKPLGLAPLPPAPCLDPLPFGPTGITTGDGVKRSRFRDGVGAHTTLPICHTPKLRRGPRKVNCLLTQRCGISLRYEVVAVERVVWNT